MQWLVKFESGEVGFFVAPDLKKMFWAIDEHSNPFSVKYKEFKNSFGIVFPSGYGDALGEDSDEVNIEVDSSNLFVTENFIDSLWCQKKWKDPVWPKDVYS